VNLKKSIGLALMSTLVLVACGADGSGVEAAKSEVCDKAPEWQATLEKVEKAEEDPGTLSGEVDELATGIEEATTALSDAGADAIATAAASFGERIDGLATSLDEGTTNAAEKATEALTRLDALSTLAGCDA
jgi:hypothetical protein